MVTDAVIQVFCRLTQTKSLKSTDFFNNLVKKFIVHVLLKMAETNISLAADWLKSIKITSFQHELLLLLYEPEAVQSDYRASNSEASVILLNSLALMSLHIWSCRSDRQL